MKKLLLASLIFISGKAFGVTTTLRPQYFNVKDYGAIGNGVVDDSTATRTAIGYSTTTGGGTIFFPCGTYLWGSKVTLYSSMTVLGQSPGCVVIKAKNGMNDRLIVNAGRDNGLFDYNVNLENLVFDMNGANQTGSSAPTFSHVNGHRVKKCQFRNAYDSLYLLTGPANTSTNYNAYYENDFFDGTNQQQATDVVDIGSGTNIWMNDIYSYNAKSNTGAAQISAAIIDGFSLTNSLLDGVGNGATMSISGVNGGKVDGCEIKNSKEAGIRLQYWLESPPDKFMENFSITNNKIHGSGFSGLWVRAAGSSTQTIKNLLISNNNIYFNQQEAVKVTIVDNLTISQNHLNSNSLSSAGTYPAINLNQGNSVASALKNVVVDYNIISDTQSTPTQTFIFNLNFSSNVKTSNNLILNSTGIYVVSNSSTNVFDDFDQPRYKVASLTRDMTASSGDVSYTGVGFQPKALIFLAGNGTAISAGLDTIINHGVVSTFGATYTDTTGQSIYVVNGSDVGQKGLLKSLDSSGFTITWTKSGAPSAGTADVYYMALR